MLPLNDPDDENVDDENCFIEEDEEEKYYDILV